MKLKVRKRLARFESVPPHGDTSAAKMISTIPAINGALIFSVFIVAG